MNLGFTVPVVMGSAVLVGIFVIGWVWEWLANLTRSVSRSRQLRRDRVSHTSEPGSSLMNDFRIGGGR